MAPRVSLHHQEHDDHPLAVAETPPTAPPYAPPNHFKLVENPPLIEDVASDGTELWLIRLSDNGLRPEEFKKKQVHMRLHPSDGKLSHFQNSNGNLYDIVALEHEEAAQPFVFAPKTQSASLHVRRISRQVTFVRSLDSNVESREKNTSSAKKDGQYEENYDIMSERRSSSKRKQKLVSERFSNDVFSMADLIEGAVSQEVQRANSISSRGKASAGTSTLESLQEDQRISTAHVGTSFQKRFREEEQISSLSKVSQVPKRSAQEESEMVTGEGMGEFSGRKLRKQKKARSEEGYARTKDNLGGTYMALLERISLSLSEIDGKEMSCSIDCRWVQHMINAFSGKMYHEADQGICFISMRGNIMSDPAI